ncbi:MAG: O-antigen ligase family protein [Salinivirgaceae bacterium]
MHLIKAISIKDFYKVLVGKNLLIFSLLLLVLGLPLSPFLVGSSQFLLFFNWILEGNWSEKFQRFKSNRILWLFLILPVIHVLWLFNTHNLDYAIHDIKIKLPLLLFPLVMGTSNALSKKEVELIFKFFLFAVFSGTVVTVAILTGIYNHPYNDIRETSIFISHIRFGLMIVFSMVLTSYFILKSYLNQQYWVSLGFFILNVWFLLFLVILQSITSWIILFFLINFLFFFYYHQIKWRYLKTIGWSILGVILILSLSLVGKVCYDFYFTSNPKFSELPTHSPRGNMYWNDTLSEIKENGHYVQVLVCYKELSTTWPKLSNIPYEGNDANDYPIWSTLVRYLASKGLPKDYDGLMALDAEDIKMIEQGYASCVYRSRFIPYIKVYDLIWELDMYAKTGNANFKSVAQRMEYWKGAALIIKKNFLFGIGTGDLIQEYKVAYNQLHSKLDVKNLLRAHNQFITFFVTFGFVGFLLAIVSMFLPGYYSANKNSFVLVAFLVIIFLSMLNEDTLETQAGVTFYILFYTLLVFSKNEN